MTGSAVQRDTFRGAKLIAGGTLIVALVALPAYGDQYTLTTFIRTIYFGFLALSVGFLLGQGGMISLTQTAFFGISGYVVGLLGAERGLPFPIPELAGLGLVAATALLFGLVVMRTHGIVFLMLTLALGQICWSFARQNTSVLHGWAGIRGIQPPSVFGLDLTQNATFYWMSLVLFGLGLLLLWRLVESPFGLALNGIRESPRRMSALGYPVFWLRVMAFVIAALYAGVGGILAAWSSGIVTPTALQLSRTIWILLVVILGGARYFWGPVLGAVIAVWLDVIISQLTPRYNTVIGIVFVVVILVAPNGILGVWEKISAKRRRFRGVAESDHAEALSTAPKVRRRLSRAEED
ncbi:branched-chain amino acid ABC transporter permease [Shumkonia mesophila]|uniref:branched-chain amino acid ABC transporter permease n=1 Tax=Shumkonia mesophila TaxID=2838854 RepID=UPI0029348F24|nr:branched-chain amino acid ABC transporter permease [Shumkonia mesophila]